MAQSLLRLSEDSYLYSSRNPMIKRVFVEVACVKPGGDHDALRGRWSIRLAFAAAMAAALLPFTTRAQGVGKQLLHGHMPPAVARFHLQPMSRLPATNCLNLAIWLSLRNQEAMTSSSVKRISCHEINC